VLVKLSLGLQLDLELEWKWERARVPELAREKQVAIVVRVWIVYLVCLETGAAVRVVEFVVVIVMPADRWNYSDAEQ
jgi:hypothetical protein